MFTRVSGKVVCCRRSCSISYLRRLLYQGVVLQRFVEEPMIVSGLVYLDNVPKSEDGRPREEGKLKTVRRAV